MKYIRGGVLLATALFGVQASWAQAPKFTIQNFAISGNTLLPADTTQAAVAPFVGKERSMDDITKAADALRSAYAAAGYPVVQVFPPEQTAADGVIALRVIEGKLTKVSVEGNQAYDTANIRASLPALKEGTSPNAPGVVADIVLANENPAKQVAVDFKAGATAGDIDATIKVTEDRIEKTTVTYDNAGSQAAGYNRISIAYQHANIGNLDHMLSLGINTTVEHPLDNGLNIVAGYRIPFYQHGISLDLIGSYSDSRTSSSVLGVPINFTGRGTYLGTRVNHALPSIGEYRHKMVYGLDYKDFANEVMQGGVPTNQGTVTSTPVSIGYVAQMATPSYQAGGTVTYASNLGYGHHGTQPLYDADTPGAPNQWDVWRGTAFIALPLPEDWQFRATGNFQFSDNRLVNVERFGIGGASSVRGYSERVANGDSGYSFNLELYTPDFGKHLADNVKARGVFFFDQGQVRQTANMQTPTMAAPVILSSIGVGLRLNYGKDLAIKADLGFSQTPNALETPGNPNPTMPARQAYGLKPDGDRWGLHLSANYTF
jgi:hemolysin activation/secretion protein